MARDRGGAVMFAAPIWFDEPAPTQEDPDCQCRFIGDEADASVCPLHGVSREPAVKLAGHESDSLECPF
jgi:hypothetical protein